MSRLVLIGEMDRGLREWRCRAAAGNRGRLTYGRVQRLTRHQEGSIWWFRYSSRREQPMVCHRADSAPAFVKVVAIYW